VAIGWQAIFSLNLDGIEDVLLSLLPPYVFYGCLICFFLLQMQQMQRFYIKNS
jgi:hypothetical protein